jgi:hypothetical protein
VTEEGVERCLPSSKTTEAASGHPSKLLGIRRSVVSHLGLHDGIALLLGVQIRRVRWQPFDPDVARMSSQVRGHFFRAMRPQPVPDDSQSLSQLPLKCLQDADDIRALDVSVKVSREQSRGPSRLRHRQSNDAGHFPSLADPLQDWRCSERSPRSRRARPKRMSGLVDEDDNGTAPLSPLFMRGQSCVSHA